MTSMNKQLLSRQENLERRITPRSRPTVTLVFVDENDEVVMTAGPEGRWHRSKNQRQNLSSDEEQTVEHGT
jgi:hypothetical protein